jgi:hypothetical protein
MSVLTDNPISSWQFLQEPLWRWFIMFGAAIMISIMWRGVIDFAK